MALCVHFGVESPLAVVSSLHQSGQLLDRLGAQVLYNLLSVSLPPDRTKVTINMGAILLNLAVLRVISDLDSQQLETVARKNIAAAGEDVRPRSGCT